MTRIDPHGSFDLRNNGAEFTTKDSGEREDFATGMVRDTQTGKPRFDLIPVGPLRRLADLYTRGAAKYDDNNWRKGQPFSRAYASLFRHLIQWRAGDRSEDHLAGVAWNAFALMYYEDNKPELDDVGVLPKLRPIGKPISFDDFKYQTEVSDK